MSTERVGKRIKIRPTVADYNHLMYTLEWENRTLMMLVPRYGMFGNLKGFYAYLSYEYPADSHAKSNRKKK